MMPEEMEQDSEDERVPDWLKDKKDLVRPNLETR